jgi:hypothetical protein
VTTPSWRTVISELDEEARRTRLEVAGMGRWAAALVQGMRRTWLTVVAGLALALAGCAGSVQQPYWAGTDPERLRRDHYECKVDAMEATPGITAKNIMLFGLVGAVVSAGVQETERPAYYGACMTSRGHRLVISPEWAAEYNMGVENKCRREFPLHLADGPRYERCVADQSIAPVNAPAGWVPLTPRPPQAQP